MELKEVLICRRYISIYKKAVETNINLETKKQRSRMENLFINIPSPNKIIPTKRWLKSALLTYEPLRAHTFEFIIPIYTGASVSTGVGTRCVESQVHFTPLSRVPRGTYASECVP